MGVSVRRLSIVALLACMVSPVTGAGALDDFAWLEGSWSREGRRGEVRETWRIASDRTLEGEARSISSATGKDRLGESMLLVEMGGEIFYIPRPMENPLPVAFRLISHEAGRAVFENPAHDFPTRIIYRRNDDGSMTVRVEGPGDDGELRGIDFHFRRVD